MKIIMISDLHLVYDRPVGRIDNVVLAQFEKLDFLYSTAQQKKAIILQAGDFTDVPRSWRLLGLLMSFFNSVAPVDTYACLGQHDKYMYSQEIDSTIMGALSGAGFVKLLGSDPVIIGDICIYGCNYGDEPTVKYYGERNILVIHAPLAAQAMNFPGVIQAEQFIARHKEFEVILCGDIHKRFTYVTADKRRIVNSGPMLRLSVDDWDHLPGFYVYDTDDKSFEWISFPVAPVKEVLSRKHLVKRDHALEVMKDFVNAVKEDFNGGVDFYANLDRFMQTQKVSEPVRQAVAQIIADIKD